MSSDKEYIETKRIVQGKATMLPEFRTLAEWIDKTYDVKTINIIYDTIDNGQRPRLQICFEFEKEKSKFMNKGDFGMNKPKQQQIAYKFKELFKNPNLLKKSSFFDFFRPKENVKYMTDNIWVIYGAFEPIAKMEAGSNIPNEKIIELKESLANVDLWEIHSMFSSATFFLHTDELVKKYKNSETLNIWTNKYFDLLDNYNEFGYFKRDSFSIYLDSKENFDNNYQSNWYYYYK